MLYFRTKQEIAEIWKQTKPSEREQIIEFIKANSQRSRFRFFLCCILRYDTQAEFITAGLSLDGSDEVGVWSDELLQMLEREQSITAKPLKPPRSSSVSFQKPPRKPSVGSVVPSGATKQLSLFDRLQELQEARKREEQERVGGRETGKKKGKVGGKMLHVRE
jgi:hypothetical protein